MSPAGGANYIGPSEKAPYACIATCAAVVQFAVYHMPPPGEAPFSVGTVLNVHGAGDNRVHQLVIAESREFFPLFFYTYVPSA